MGKVWVITGPMGGGKSTVAKQLAERGAKVLDADEIVARLLASDEEVRRGLAELFGEAVVAEPGRVDRRKIADAVFAEESLRLRLERLVHPPVLAEMEREAISWRKRGQGLLLLEVVLWLQQPEPPFPVDGVLLVTAPREELLARVAARSRLAPERAAARLAAQGNWEELADRADRVLDTSFPDKELPNRAGALYLALLAED